MLLLEVADGATAEGFGPVADQVVAVATGAAEKQRLWALRERQSEVYATLPGLQKLDVSVRLADLDAAVAAIRAVVADRRRRDAEPARTRRRPPRSGPAGTRPWVGIFGHALDGNLHVQLVGADAAARRRVLAAVAALGGSISAEHGIGRQKVDQLHLARSGGGDRLDAPDQGDGRPRRVAEPRRAARTRAALIPATVAATGHGRADRGPPNHRLTPASGARPARPIGTRRCAARPYSERPRRVRRACWGPCPAVPW